MMMMISILKHTIKLIINYPNTLNVFYVTLREYEQGICIYQKYFKLSSKLLETFNYDT